MSRYFLLFMPVFALCAAIFTSCDKKGELKSDDDLFVPPSDMTQEQIVDLLGNAIKATISSDLISYTYKYTTNAYPLSGEWEEDYSYSLSRQTQKSLEVLKYEDYLQFCFIDGYNVYQYFQTGSESYKAKLADIYWLPYHIVIGQNDFDLLNDNYIWTINGPRITGKVEGFFPTLTGFFEFHKKMEITLTNDLKIKDFYNLIQVGDSFHKKKCSCTYSANPQMPQNYSIFDFNPLPQYEVKIVWEDGTENIFYTYYHAETGIHLFSPSMIYLEPPPGKVVQLFYDANYTQPVENQIVVADTTFYAKWVTM